MNGQTNKWGQHWPMTRRGVVTRVYGTELRIIDWMQLHNFIKETFTNERKRAPDAMRGVPGSTTCMTSSQLVIGISDDAVPFSREVFSFDHSI